MGILKDFFSLRWLSGSTVGTGGAVASTGSGSSSVTSAQSRTSTPATPTAIFDNDVNPNKAFPALMWAFFYGVFLIMIFIAIVGWRSDLFLRGINVIATIFALILAFLFGLVSIMYAYVGAISVWQAVKIVSDIAKKPADFTGEAIRALSIGYAFAFIMGGLSMFGMYAVGNTFLGAGTKMNIMFSQIGQESNVRNTMVAGYSGVATSNIPDRHVVKSGETLKSIADKYGLDVNSVATLNSIADVNKIEKGQILKLK